MVWDTETKEQRRFALPGAKPHYNPDRPGQVTHIALDLVLDMVAQTLGGICRITLLPLRSSVDHLLLDGVNLVIEGVTVGDLPRPFTYDGQRLRIALDHGEAGEPLTVAIAYRTEQPQRGVYFIAPDAIDPQKPVQVWTQGEDEDSRFWFPCLDYPGQLATSEIRMQVPQPYQMIANGRLVGLAKEGDHQIFHWRLDQPHPSYLMAFAVGEFDSWEDCAGAVPLHYYVAKGRRTEGERLMGQTPAMMRFLEDYYGVPYAFGSYSQACVADFIFGGMENTSLTLLTDRCLLDERADLERERGETLVLHELAHQWFGDLAVIRHWSHAWIKEGMATYAEVLWTEHSQGTEAAAYYRWRLGQDYFAEDAQRYRRPIVTHIYREPIELYDCHLYQKASWVYHMIRQQLGEQGFRKAIQNFLQTHHHGTVETVDLLRAVDRTTGINILPLLDQYVFRGGHPDFKVGYSWDSGSNLAKLTIDQTQDADTLFDLSIPVGFAYLAGDQVTFRTVNLRIHEAHHDFYFPLDQEPDFVSFDQGNHWLKTVELAYPLGVLEKQLRHDPDPLSRIAAAQALGKQASREALNRLATALGEERFWGVRVEIAGALATIPLPSTEAALLPGLGDPDHRVRAAAIAGLAQQKTSGAYDAIRAIAAAGDASYSTEAAAINVLGGMVALTLKDRLPETLELWRRVLAERAGWNETVRSGAIAGLAQCHTSPEAAQLILDYTASGVPQPLRLAAIRALGPVSKYQTPDMQAAIRQRLALLSRDTYFLTQVMVVRSLGQMTTPEALALLGQIVSQSLDGRVKRMAEEALGKVQKAIGSDQNLQDLRQQLEALQQKHREVLERLDKLEALNPLHSFNP